MKPWHRTLNSIKLRCNKKVAIEKHRNYWGKGIKCLITADELEWLWFRDNASKMDKPSIDRINPKDHYKVENCRYIEARLNTSLQFKKKTSKYIGIYYGKNLTGNYWRGEFIKGGKIRRTHWHKTERGAFNEFVEISGGVKPVIRSEALKKIWSPMNPQKESTKL